jgi:hypothetical protein
MNSKDVYKQKIEAELKQVQAKLAEFEAPKKSLTADARIKYDKQLNNLKQKVYATRTQLKERSEANKDVWDLLRYCF